MFLQTGLVIVPAFIVYQNLFCPICLSFQSSIFPVPGLARKQISKRTMDCRIEGCINIVPYIYRGMNKRQSGFVPSVTESDPALVLPMGCSV